MGVCYYGILWIIIPDLPQVAEVAETAEEEKSPLKSPVAILKSNINSILASLPFNPCSIT
uniref:Uncharacterized protein n=1 Tax=Medicago truncatula TaxID=3880 RepID=I3SQ68_MEDTR|nr:unknown [Medicago truncatula]